MLLDIHTHHQPNVLSEAIQNISFKEFQAQKGGYYSVGIHPWDVTSNWETDFDVLRKTATDDRIIAIGEVGIDRFVTDNIMLQKAAFERQIALSEELRLPLIIHCVKCYNELIQLKRDLHPKQPWIVHGFRNNPFIAERLLSEDMYISFGDRYQSTVVQMVPDEKLFVETDESESDIRLIIKGIADVKGKRSDDFIWQIDTNVQHVFFKH
ncbi:TatD family hydrolase [Phocaeicola oris]|uniref:TatD family hydrolase n=1 Tax=Phocaeicola oris TaxID=2896850 RepID=UPI00234F074D|nr:TatD family hydrolase [Phocaeicola oris]MCE2616764.1 TatD family hydrolase [Phocaeicola oris]